MLKTMLKKKSSDPNGSFVGQIGLASLEGTTAPAFAVSSNGSDLQVFSVQLQKAKPLDLKVVRVSFYVFQDCS